MKLQDIIDAETQVRRTLSGLKSIGIDDKTKKDLANAEYLLSEVRHYAVSICDLNTIGEADEAIGAANRMKTTAADRLTNFINHGIAKD
jgi:hypothetical protein